MNAQDALRQASNVPYWLDPEAGALGADRYRAPELTEDVTADLAVVGGGYSGLWTALLAAERHPGLRVVLLEARTIGSAASGRNGGFISSSLTHGLANGWQRYPEEIQQLEALGTRNLAEIQQAVERYSIQCEFDRPGQLRVATAPWQLSELREAVRMGRAVGHDRTLLDADQVRSIVDSPTYVGGMISRGDYATAHPARLAWGLADAAASQGVRLYAASPVADIGRESDGLRLTTPKGSVRAAKVAWATGAFPSPLKRIRQFVLPVYDYALVTEPLERTIVDRIGLGSSYPIVDSGNRFHYYRLLADRRILFGGYDAIYYFGNKVSSDLEYRPATFEVLYRHLLETFPQLGDVRVSHAWGGVIDTSSRFMPMFGTAYGGRLAYVSGYTGLGVAATRFGAQVLLDRLAGRETERTRLKMVRRKPVPFPPEPLRYPIVRYTAWSIARADEQGGRRNLWLRLLDALGIGFDS